MVLDSSNDFHAIFKTKYDDISRYIEEGEQTPEKLLKAIDELQKTVQQRIDKLTSYDQEQYGSSLQSLKEKIWKQKKTKKFKFRTKIAKQKTPEQLTAHSKRTETDSFSPQETITHMEESTQANVAIKNLTKSIVVYKEITGAAYIDNVSDSKLYSRPQQCRVHNSQNLEIISEKCTAPSLEKCNNISFIVSDSAELKVFDFSANDNRNYHVKTISESSWRPISTLVENDLNNR